jgi:hypothetical protein
VFITAALDAGISLRDTQEAASHAETRTSAAYPALSGAGVASAPEVPTVPEAWR